MEDLTKLKVKELSNGIRGCRRFEDLCYWLGHEPLCDFKVKRKPIENDENRCNNNNDEWHKIIKNTDPYKLHKLLFPYNNLDELYKKWHDIYFPNSPIRTESFLTRWINFITLETPSTQCTPNISETSNILTTSITLLEISTPEIHGSTALPSSPDSSSSPDTPSSLDMSSISEFSSTPEISTTPEPLTFITELPSTLKTPITLEIPSTATIPDDTPEISVGPELPSTPELSNSNPEDMNTPEKSRTPESSCSSEIFSVSETSNISRTSSAPNTPEISSVYLDILKTLEQSRIIHSEDFEYIMRVLDTLKKTGYYEN